MDVDYLILGGGCAGLGLAVNFINSDLRDKRILILEGREKYKRDKTWCSWDVYPHQFRDAISHTWLNYKFASKNSEAIFTGGKCNYYHRGDHTSR